MCIKVLERLTCFQDLQVALADYCEDMLAVIFLLMHLQIVVVFSIRHGKNLDFGTVTK